MSSLNDERCMEMYRHCKQTLCARAGKMKMFVPKNGTAFPIIKAGSVLNLRPAIKVVNTFPIDEDREVEGVGLYRPMYYCELRAVALVDINKRTDIRKKTAMRKRKEMGNGG